MDAPSAEDLLESAARNGTLDVCAEWPRVLENVLKKLHSIVHTEFPFPSKPEEPSKANYDADPLGASPLTGASPTPRSTQDFGSHDRVHEPSQVSNNEKEGGGMLQGADPSGTPMGPPSRTARASQGSQEAEDPLAPYPELSASYKSSINILKTAFAESPPYTIQRLAELVLRPHAHYRYLPPFLNGLDRIVSVSSSTTSFPLLHHTNGIFLTNGDQDKSTGPAGDEGLGGALLTPIPWLRRTTSEDEIATGHPDGELRTEGTETIEGPHGSGRIETVSVTVNGVSSSSQAATTTSTSVEAQAPATEQALREQGAVTQGELIRQEQQAGVVPVAQATARRNVGSQGGAAALSSIESDEADDLPHVRGPEEIGVSDLGPQTGELGAGRPLDIDAALGRASKSPPPSVEADTKGPELAKQDDGEGTTSKDEDGDFVLVDADADTDVS